MVSLCNDARRDGRLHRVDLRLPWVRVVNRREGVRPARHDLEAALDYMRDDLGISPRDVLLVGASMGGTASLLVAEREPVAGVVSISSPATYQEIDAVASVGEIVRPSCSL